MKSFLILRFSDLAISFDLSLMTNLKIPKFRNPKIRNKERMFLQRRNRILRTNASIRSLVAETTLTPSDVIAPYLLMEVRMEKQRSLPFQVIIAIVSS